MTSAVVQSPVSLPLAVSFGVVLCLRSFRQTPCRPKPPTPNIAEQRCTQCGKPAASLVAKHPFCSGCGDNIRQRPLAVQNRLIAKMKLRGDA